MPLRRSLISCRLLIHTEPYWQKAITDGSVKALTIDGAYVLIRYFGGLMIILSGVDDVDELVLADLIDCLYEVVCKILGGGGRNDSSITEAENFCKLSLSIDEMFPQVRVCT